MIATPVKTEYDFLVLTDFSDASYKALKYTISLAKLIKSSIHLCYISNPGKIAENDNQLAAMRELSLETGKVKRKMRSLVEIITAEGINAIPHSSIGNIVGEFEDYIEVINPDLVVFGKKKENPKLSGKITNHLMNKYAGSVLIIGGDSEFTSDTKISLGCNNETLNRYNPNLLFSLNRQTKSPLTLLKIKNGSNSNEQIQLPVTWGKSDNGKEQHLDFVYENDSVISQGLLDHLSKNNTDMLCIGRGKSKNMMQKVFANSSNIASDVIQHVDIPILLMGKNAYN